MSFRTYAIPLAMSVFMGGCYVYEPMRPADAMLDSRVRATVTADQAAELAPVLRNVTPQVVGTLSQRDAGGIIVDVPILGGPQGTSSRPMHNRVSIPMDKLVSLERRKLSQWRTAVAVGAVAAAVAGSWTILSDDKTSSEKPGDGVDNAIRIRIPLVFGFR